MKQRAKRPVRAADVLTVIKKHGPLLTNQVNRLALPDRSISRTKQILDTLRKDEKIYSRNGGFGDRELAWYTKGTSVSVHVLCVNEIAVLIAEACRDNDPKYDMRWVIGIEHLVEQKKAFADALISIDVPTGSGLGVVNIWIIYDEGIRPLSELEEEMWRFADYLRARDVNDEPMWRKHYRTNMSFPNQGAPFLVFVFSGGHDAERRNDFADHLQNSPGSKVAFATGLRVALTTMDDLGHDSAGPLGPAYLDAATGARVDLAGNQSGHPSPTEPAP